MFNTLILRYFYRATTVENKFKFKAYIQTVHRVSLCIGHATIKFCLNFIEIQYCVNYLVCLNTQELISLLF